MTGSTDQAQIYAGTPDIVVMDNRVLPVRALRLNRTDAAGEVDVQVARSVLDAGGFAQTVTDPRLGALAEAVPNFRYQNSLGGQALHVDGVDNGESTVFFDIEGRMIWQRDARQTVMTYTYDAFGRVTEVWQQLAGESVPALIGKAIYGDNDPGLPRAQAQAANLCGVASKQWDTAGYGETGGISLSGQPQVQSRTLLARIEGDPDWSKDSAGQLETVAYTNSLKANALGMVLQQTDALGNLQGFGYDVALRLSQSQLTETDGSAPQMLLKSVAYDASGQIAREVSGNDTVTTYTYEPQTQRLIRLTTDRPDRDAKGQTRQARLQDLTYDYDPGGNILSINDAAQATRFYRNRAVTAGNLYRYDALYQLVEATGRENAGAASLTSADLQPIVPLPNDLSVLTPYKRQYRYDRGGNLTQIQHIRAAQGYTRNIVVAAASNRAMMQNSSNSLTPANINSTYFDACGNALQLQPDSTQPLAWNGRNALQSVTLVERQLPAQSDREVYQYDAGGRRVRKTTLRYKDDGQSCQRDTVIYLPGVEIRKTETVSTSQPDQPTLTEELHVLSPGSTGRAGVQRLSWRVGRPQAIPASQTRYSFSNQTGSVTLELDQNADILTIEEYYPFGGTAVASAASQSEAKYRFIRYSGKERDATGLYYYGQRYYQPWIGRWLNTDPAGTIDGTNLYRMVRNNPVTYRDLHGLAPGDKRKIDDTGEPSTSKKAKVEPVTLTKDERNDLLLMATPSSYKKRKHEQVRVNTKFGLAKDAMTKKGSSTGKDESHQAEHVIGFAVLAGDAAPRGGRTFGGPLEDVAPSYMEAFTAHRAHVGTGNHADKYGISSEEYRRTQRNLLEAGAPGAAIAYNQLWYAHNDEVRKFWIDAKDDPALNKPNVRADDSFSEMLKNTNQITYAVNAASSSTGNRWINVPMSDEDKAEAALARLLARTGVERGEGGDPQRPNKGQVWHRLTRAAVRNTNRIMEKVSWIWAKKVTSRMRDDMIDFAMPNRGGAYREA